MGLYDQKERQAACKFLLVGSLNPNSKGTKTLDIPTSLQLVKNTKTRTIDMVCSLSAVSFFMFIFTVPRTVFHSLCDHKREVTSGEGIEGLLVQKFHDRGYLIFLINLREYFNPGNID